MSKIIFVLALMACSFSVHSMTFQVIDKFPEVDGWIERWNWVKESEGLKEAPARWVD